MRTRTDRILSRLWLAFAAPLTATLALLALRFAG